MHAFGVSLVVVGADGAGRRRLVQRRGFAVADQRRRRHLSRSAPPTPRPRAGRGAGGATGSGCWLSILCRQVMAPPKAPCQLPKLGDTSQGVSVHFVVQLCTTKKRLAGVSTARYGFRIWRHRSRLVLSAQEENKQ